MAPRGIVGLYVELTKARLSSLVVVTCAVGFIMAGRKPIDWTGLFLTSLGTALIATGVCGLNQWMEVKRDAMMQRTCKRPLPSRSMGTLHAAIFSLLLTISGPLLLYMSVNVLATQLALLSGLLYIFLYTPLKPYSTANTLVGAVVGALPPMIGWVGATGTLEPGAFILGGILFVWQIPHFLALAWLYRRDYARGGFRMLPVVDTDGRITTIAVVLYSLALIPISLMTTLAGLSGWIYAGVAVLLGLWFSFHSVMLFRHRSEINARRVFRVSLIYLPLLLLAMLLDQQSARAGDRHPTLASEARSSTSRPISFP